MFNSIRLKISAILVFCFFIILITLANFFDLGKLSDKKIKFASDLSGGEQVLLQVDLDSYLEEKFINYIDLLKKEFIENRIKAVPKLKKDLYGEDEENLYVRIKLNRQSDLHKIKSILSVLDKDLIFIAEENFIDLKYKDSFVQNLERVLVNKTINTLRKRTFQNGQDNFIFKKKDGDKILVKASNKERIEKLKETINKSGVLTFNFVKLDGENSVASIRNVKKVKARNSNYKYTVEKNPVITGEFIIDAQMTYNKGVPVIVFRFDAKGTQKFAEITKKNLSKTIAVILDDEVIMAPRISMPITDGAGVIAGNFNEEEAINIANTLKAGALPCEVKIVKEESFKSVFDCAVFKNTVWAILALFIVLSLLFFVLYKKFGIFANITTLLNICLTITLLSLFGVVLSLSGIIAFATSIFILMSLNFITFNKLKKYRKDGKTILNSIEKAFVKSSKEKWSYVLIVIAFCLLYLLGGYCTREFSLVFIIGFLSSLFINLYLLKVLIMLNINNFNLKKIKF